MGLKCGGYPRCHLPIRAVLYPASRNSDGMVGCAGGMPKVVLRCESEAALLALADEAEAAGLPVMLIRDAGRTVVEAGTPTCVGIGPADILKIDAITGTLKLVR